MAGALLTSAVVNFTTPSSSDKGHDDKDWNTDIEMWLFGVYGYSAAPDVSESLVRYYYTGTVPFHDDGSTHQVAFDLSARTSNGTNVTLDKDTFSYAVFAMLIHPGGHDTWVFQPTITLTFADNTQTTLRPPDVTYVVVDADQGNPWMQAQFTGPAPTSIPSPSERREVGGVTSGQTGQGGIINPFVGPKHYIP